MDALGEEIRFARRLSEELITCLFALPSVTPLFREAADDWDLELRCAVRSEQSWIRMIATLIDGDHQVRGAKTFSFPRAANARSPLSVADGLRAIVQQALSGTTHQPDIEVFEQSEEIDRAIYEFETAHNMMPQDAAACGLLGFAYGLSGKTDSANGLLHKLQRSPDLRGQAIYAEAIIHMGLGARDEAISVLGEAVQRRGTPGLIFANAIFDPIRTDRRFVKIQRQIELTH